MGDAMRTRASSTLVGLLAVARCASTVVLGAPAPASAAGLGAGNIVVVRSAPGLPR